VGGEVALRPDRRLDAIEHPVERPRELGELVVRAVGAEAAAEVVLPDRARVVLADRPRGACEVAHGPQRPRGEDAAGRERRDGDGAEQGEEPQGDLAPVGGQRAAPGGARGAALGALLATRRPAVSMIESSTAMSVMKFCCCSQPGRSKPAGPLR
jgi:hypothetical protein